MNTEIDDQRSRCPVRSERAGGYESHCDHWWDGGLCHDCGALPAAPKRTRVTDECQRLLTERREWLLAQDRGSLALKLLADIVIYAREDEAETPGVTRLARALEAAERLLGGGQ